MRRAAIALSVLLATLALAATAQADPSEYGIKALSASASSYQAGAHPDFTVDFALKTVGEDGKTLPAITQSTRFELPPALLANPTAVPTCSAAQLLGTDMEDKAKPSCPQDSQVGVTEITLCGISGCYPLTEPIFNMEPRHGEPARFGFFAELFPVMIGAELRSDGDYGATASVEGIAALIPLLAAKTTFWGVPADPIHDALRVTPYEAAHNGGVPETPNGKRSSNLIPTPLMVNPTRCGVTRQLVMTARSYALPETPSQASTSMPPVFGCGLLGFKPAMSVAPTTAQAESATGLDVELELPQPGLEHPNLLATSHFKRVEVTLPEGVTANPSAAQGLGVCAPADFAKETASSGPNEGCPESSKIGNATATSPLLDEVAQGSLYLAKPHENPFGTLLALYLVMKVPERGIVVALAGKVQPDPKTGQLVTTFDEIPQLPVSGFHLHFREGARSPLITPPACGSYQTVAKLTPWSAVDPNNPKASEIATATSSFAITSGVGHGPCPPQGKPPFAPGFSAGATNNNAGAHSPVNMRLTRRDGDQDLTRFDATLPPGLLAKLAGVSRCSDAAIAAAKAKSGKAELASPSCPANSQIGRTLAGAGVGSVLTYVPGSVYLAGPFAGAPLSVAAITPAVAGPFDVGTVVVRQALTVHPRSGVARVDGARSDPIPHILAGIPLKVRDVRVYVDRPGFTINPTSCDPMAIGADLWGGGIDVFSSADDAPVGLVDRFQAANCANLGFKPHLRLQLKGATKRGGHPALRGTFLPRPGDASLKGLTLRLPHSAFLEQAHIRTICTRVQFATKSCPPGAIYGHARAFTPLLDEPLEGPVYLRSSSNPLPDFVADLRGLVDIEAVARIDSKNGGIRATFLNTPDAPLSKVVVNMQGGKKGLIVNSLNLCAHPQRANASFAAHNGKRHQIRPKVVAMGCKKKGKAKAKRSGPSRVSRSPRESRDGSG